MNSERVSLSALKPGECCIIDRLAVTGQMRRRLIDLGFAPGERVECVGVSPLGDPHAYCVRCAVIALRRDSAAGIEVLKR